MLLNNVCIIGVGLIGGSLGLDIKKHGLAKKVVGVVRRESAIKESLDAGVVDEATMDLTKAVSEADLIIFATPIATIVKVAQKISSAAKDNAIVIDVASVKGKLVPELDEIFGSRIRYVGTHPMAGSEKKGVFGVKEDLYLGATCIITPTDKTNKEAVRTVVDFWSQIGAKTLILSLEEHDKLVALSSHLPHLAAAGLVNVLKEEENIKQCIGPGFRDTTRIAGSNPDLWCEICEWNRDKIIETLDRYQKEFAEIAEIITAKQWDRLADKLNQAKTFRDSL